MSSESKSTEKWRPAIQPDCLIERARIIKKIRRFFDDRGVLEVDTPAISRFPAIDVQIDTPKVFLSATESDSRYLISSPEYHMKRMLCSGAGSIYQICKCFRLDEVGEKHNPEFTMLEWYRVGWDQWELMTEIEALLNDILGISGADRIAYHELFQNQLEVTCDLLTFDQFTRVCDQADITPPESFIPGTFNRDEALDFLMGMLIEPGLGKTNPVFVHSYPASQASLSRLQADNPTYSTRFEVYYKGMELGNGFYELADAVEQRRRFESDNRKRLAAGKSLLPVDERFLAALENGLPDCSGVAMGVDRMVMLALGQTQINQVISFPWDRC